MQEHLQQPDTSYVLGADAAAGKQTIVIVHN